MSDPDGPDIDRSDETCQPDLVETCRRARGEYFALSARFAMRIARPATLDEFRPDTWDMLAASVGIGAPYTRRRVRALAQAIKAQAPRVAAALGDAALEKAALDRYADIVTARAVTFL